MSAISEDAIQAEKIFTNIKLAEEAVEKKDWRNGLTLYKELIEILIKERG